MGNTETRMASEEWSIMKCAIMQPTYYPWAGYFNLISKVDYFVFLDDAQFQKGSWHNRNKLILNGKPSWVTIPVVREFLGQKICDSKLDDTKTWRKEHFNSIYQNYSKHPYFEKILPLIEFIKDESYTLLSSFNIRIIKEISKILDLQTTFILSSELGVSGKRSEWIINICKKLGCSEYISPKGAKTYLEEDGFDSLSNIKLTINDFIPKSYLQMKSRNFESHLSIIDVMANIGPQTQDYIL